MGGHDHHEPQLKIPDWKKFKVADCPQLQTVENMLAAKGLKDPWLRNHIWKFPQHLHPNLNIRLLKNLSHGIRTGAILCGVGIVLEFAYKLVAPPQDHGHH